MKETKRACESTQEGECINSGVSTQLPLHPPLHSMDHSKLDLRPNDRMERVTKWPKVAKNPAVTLTTWVETECGKNGPPRRDFHAFNAKTLD